MGDNRKRGHHTVPRFYLANFSQKQKKQGQIIVANFKQKKTYPTSVARASIQNDFYSLDAETQERTGLSESAFEEHISSFEGAASLILDKILVDKVWPLDEVDRILLAQFLAVQFTRGKNQRDNSDVITSTLAKMIIAVEGKGEVSESLWKTVENDTFDVKQSPASHTLSLFRNAEEVLPHIYNRVWFLIPFTKETLLTCDTPIVMAPPLDTTPIGGPTNGFGVANASGLYFPLSRRVGLMMIDRSHFAQVPDELIRDLRQEGTPEDAKAFNKDIIKNARNEIYCHPRDKSLLPNPLPAPRGATVKAFGPSGSDWIKFGEQIRRNKD